MTRIVTIIFIVVCISVISIESIKNNAFLWYFLLLALNVISLLLLMNRPHYFKTLNYWLSAMIFPVVAFSTFIFWQYILHAIPMNLLGSELGTTSSYLSLLLPPIIGALALILILAMPVSLALGKLSCLIPLAAMFMMMFTFESWFSTSSVTDKLVLFENLCLGFFVSLMLYKSNKWIENKTTIQ